MRFRSEEIVRAFPMRLQRGGRRRNLLDFPDSFSFMTRRFALSGSRACIPRFIVPMHAGRAVRNLPEAIRRTVDGARNPPDAAIAPIVGGEGGVEIAAVLVGQRRGALAEQGCPAMRRVSERSPDVGPSCVRAYLPGPPRRTRLDGFGATPGDGGPSESLRCSAFGNSPFVRRRFRMCRAGISPRVGIREPACPKERGNSAVHRQVGLSSAPRQFDRPASTG